MEAVEERVENADAEDDAVAAERPLWTQYVARGVSVDDLRRLAAHSGDGHAGAFSVLRLADEREPVAGRAERRTAAGQRQFVCGSRLQVFTQGLRWKVTRL